ncbi:AMP-binding protein [Gryllotalpicola koreensis]|uniref:AMP-dependent synthetase/ligase domain-containing protein n=1 Tax=Gryllotalpicola koreensis TaxID=993086 RepID=A0ABP7ZQ58_9MICO
MSNPRDTPDPLALPDYVPQGQVALSDDERWPGLSAAGRARRERVLRHPLAPPWLHAAGHRLDAAAQARAAADAAAPVPPDWLAAHLARAARLPFYRDHVGPLVRLEDFPLISRDDLAADIAAFVPYGADLSEVLHGTSSGSTGAALVMPDDPDELARGFHWMVGLVRGLGVDWRPDAARGLALAHVVLQRQAFTYVSVLPAFGEAAMARVNLAEADTGFLAELDPQVISGSPTSLERLLEPDYARALHPLALFSGAMALSLPLRRELEAVFGCPVIDVYGLHETRPVAVSVDGGPHVIADRRVHVEVLDAAGRAVPPGEVGEVVVTAGENRFLPLVRYRTGDTARLVELGGRPALAELEGRANTIFTAADGHAVPCVDLTQQLQAAGARGWAVSQAADGTVSAVIAGGDEARVTDALAALLGTPIAVRRVRSIAELGEGKPRRFSTAAGSIRHG